MQRLSQEEFWAKIPHWVLTHPDLDAYAIRVYGILSKHANRVRHSFPGVRTIADEAHCSTNTVLKSLAALEEIGAIEVQRDFHGKRPKVNQYFLPMFRVSRGDTSTEAHVSPDATHVSPGDTSRVSPDETELDPKNQRIRKDDFPIPKQEPDESMADYLARIHSLMNPP